LHLPGRAGEAVVYAVHAVVVQPVTGLGGRHAQRPGAVLALTGALRAASRRAGGGVVRATDAALVDQGVAVVVHAVAVLGRKGARPPVAGGGAGPRPRGPAAGGASPDGAAATRKPAVDLEVAVVIPVVADFLGTGEGEGIAVVAIGAAAGRVTVAITVLVLRRRRAARGLRAPIHRAGIAVVARGRRPRLAAERTAELAAIAGDPVVAGNLGRLVKALVERGIAGVDRTVHPVDATRRVLGGAAGQGIAVPRSVAEDPVVAGGEDLTCLAEAVQSAALGAIAAVVVVTVLIAGAGHLLAGEAGPAVAAELSCPAARMIAVAQAHLLRLDALDGGTALLLWAGRRPLRATEDQVARLHAVAVLPVCAGGVVGGVGALVVLCVALVHRAVHAIGAVHRRGHAAQDRVACLGAVAEDAVVALEGGPRHADVAGALLLAVAGVRVLAVAWVLARTAGDAADRLEAQLVVVTEGRVRDVHAGRVVLAEVSRAVDVVGTVAIVAPVSRGGVLALPLAREQGRIQARAAKATRVR
jgi:hypothetical protein